MRSPTKYRCAWLGPDGLTHACVALRTRNNNYTMGTVCLSYEDMYMQELPSAHGVVTCLTCAVDPRSLLAGTTTQYGGP